MSLFRLGLVPVIGAAALMVSTPSRADKTVGPLSFDAHSLRVEDLQGTLDIDVIESSPRISVLMEGDKDKVESIRVRTEGGVLVIKQEGRRLRIRDILTPSFIRFIEDHPTVTVSLPRGTAVTVLDFSGEMRAGDIDAPLVFDGDGSTKGRVGNVTEAEIDLSGSGELELGKVAGSLDIELSGSTDVRVAASGTAKLDLSGSSDVRIGPVEGVLKIRTSGSANVEVESFNGEVSIRSSGSSDIDIGGGQADAFSVRVSGSSNITFAGNAYDPDIDVGDRLTSGSAR